MNNSALNTFELNGELLDSDQRSAVVANVVAQVTLNPRVETRAEFSGGLISAEAGISIAGRTLSRASVAIEAEALIGYFPRSYATAPVTIPSQALVLADGSVYQRSIYREPMLWIAEASAMASPRLLGRLVTSIEPSAEITAAAKSFALARSPLNIDASVSIWVSIDVLRRLPFDENAVEERTILVPVDDREVTVS